MRSLRAVASCARCVCSPRRAPRGGLARRRLRARACEPPRSERARGCWQIKGRPGGLPSAPSFPLAKPNLYDQNKDKHTALISGANPAPAPPRRRRLPGHAARWFGARPQCGGGRSLFRGPVHARARAPDAGRAPRGPLGPAPAPRLGPAARFGLLARLLCLCLAPRPARLASHAPHTARSVYGRRCPSADERAPPPLPHRRAAAARPRTSLCCRPRIGAGPRPRRPVCV